MTNFRLWSVVLILSMLFGLTACAGEAASSASNAAADTAVSVAADNSIDLTSPQSVSHTLQQMVTNFLLFLPKLIAALVIFVITLYLSGFISRLVRRLMERRRAEEGMILLVHLITRWTIIILGTISALQQVEFQVTAFLTGLGILGFTIGFALQDISQNVVAGLLLLLQKPFAIGDLISIDDFTGTVLSVDLRSTELRTRDGHNVLIPNASVFTKPITNYSRQAMWRINLDVGVAYDSDLAMVEQVTLQAVRALPDVLDEPAPMLHFHTFNDSSIDFTLLYWVDGRITNPFTARHPAIIAIQRAYAQQGIEIPYPIQTEIQVEAA